MKNFYNILLLLITNLSFSQVVINEIDANTAGTDALEFVEFKSATPNFSLNGYIMVFFNASSGSNVSYRAFDLNGIVTNINGIATIGDSQVSPIPNRIFPSDNIIQNGPDAIGLYTGVISSYPTGFVANTTNLSQAIFYTITNTAVAPALLNQLGLSSFINENINGLKDTQSMQRKNDGTWEVKAPTPGVPNDGSGTALNYVTTTTNLTTDPVTTLPTVTEGQAITFTFTTTTAVTTAPLVINFTLANGAFNASDYSGTLSATIPVGQTSISKTVSITNDAINDGDEEALFTMGSLASGYNINNNNIVIRVNNINFTVSPFGTPLNPTFGQVANTKPANYYASIEGLSGAALKQELQNIIANPNVIHGQNYGDIYDIMKIADQNPANSNQVWLIYTEEGRSKLDEQSGGNSLGKYNREHIYPQSRGNFADATSSTPNGINNWDAAGPDIIATGHADAHHIRAVDANENSSRNNSNYGVSDYNGPAGSTTNAWKGDVARALFYMGVRYNGLNVENGYPVDSPTTFGRIGDLATLLTWNALDNADDFEMNRNNYIYTWQINRNPFIDYPTLANYIYGSNYGQPWHAPALGTNDFEELKVSVFPNPASDFINISGIKTTASIDIYNILGEKVLTTNCSNNTTIPLRFATGIYNVRISEDGKSLSKKLVIR